MDYKPLPIGVEDFARFKQDGYYYVDKTLFIKELLDKRGMVNLFTRPRRFGKTLTLSMLKHFFEIGSDASLFEGLGIMSAGDRYTSLMGQYPVISLTLKSAKQMKMDSSFAGLKDTISGEFTRHSYISDSERIEREQLELFNAFRNRSPQTEEYKSALLLLSECLYKHHGKRVIILIDEYDVPLENSFYNGFYNEMVDFIRNFFETGLIEEGYIRTARVGIAFFKKTLRVVIEDGVNL